MTKVPVPCASAAAPLHMSLADQVQDEIANGLWRPDQRLPSVRDMSRRSNTSMTTVLAAYRTLEDRRLIESRPKKGFFVRSVPSATRQDDVLDTTTDQTDVDLIGINDSAGPTSFGAALCDQSLFPVKALSRKIASVARAHSALLTTVSLSPGMPILRDSIASHVRDWHCSVHPESVLLTNGCVEAFGLCLQAVAKAGDVIIVESPAFYGFLSTIRQLGMSAIALDFHGDLPQALVDLEKLAHAGRISACLLSTNVTNPSGASMSEAGKIALVTCLSRLGIPLIEDATFADLHFDGAPRAAMSYDETGNVLLCGSLTKTLAPGLKLGWVSGGKYHANIVAFKRAMSAGQQLLVQAAVGEYLASGGYKHHLRQLRQTCRTQVAEMIAFLYDAFGPDADITAPTGGYLVWLRLPNGVSGNAVARMALAHGISVGPGSLFSPTYAFENYLRLNCGYPMSDRRREAISMIGRFVHRIRDESIR